MSKLSIVTYAAAVRVALFSFILPDPAETAVLEVVLSNSNCRPAVPSAPGTPTPVSPGTPCSPIAPDGLNCALSIPPFAWFIVPPKCQVSYSIASELSEAVVPPELPAPGVPSELHSQL